MLAIEYWLAALMSLISLGGTARQPGCAAAWVMVSLPMETLLIAAIFFLAFRAGQGGWRWGRAEESAVLDSPPVGDRTRDECWKLGLFYVNRSDPALFLEKRFHGMDDQFRKPRGP